MASSQVGSGPRCTSSTPPGVAAFRFSQKPDLLRLGFRGLRFARRLRHFCCVQREHGLGSIRPGLVDLAPRTSLRWSAVALLLCATGAHPGVSGAAGWIFVSPRGIEKHLFLLMGTPWGCRGTPRWILCIPQGVPGSTFFCSRVPLEGVEEPVAGYFVSPKGYRGAPFSARRTPLGVFGDPSPRG